MKRLLPVLMGFVLLLFSSTDSWSLPPCPGSPVDNRDTRSNWTDCFGTYFHSNGDKYVGEFKDGNRHGQGTYNYGPNSNWEGSKYVGEWKFGKAHGQGTFTYARSGDKYVGEWKDRKHHGQGTYTYADGRVKEGIWENHKFLYAKKLSPTVTAKKSKQVRNDGGSFVKGVWFAIKNNPNCFIWNPNPQTSETASWSGTCVNGKAHGNGVLRFRYKIKDKWVETVFDGEYKDGKNHGQGTYTYGPNSKSATDKYVGEWKDSNFNGQGTHTFASGNKYVGEHKDGKRHGQGTFTFTDGRVDEGIWENGKFLYAKKLSPRVTAKKTCPGTYKPTWDKCTGTRTFHNGSKYVGQWKSGKHHGQGTLIYADGEKYVGGFRNGLHHGNGTITHANGKTLKGIWENDKFKSARD